MTSRRERWDAIVKARLALLENNDATAQHHVTRWGGIRYNEGVPRDACPLLTEPERSWWIAGWDAARIRAEGLPKPEGT